MTTILDDIVMAKRGELETQRWNMPLEALEEQIDSQPRPLNLSGALMGDRVRLIAEVKRRLPQRAYSVPTSTRCVWPQHTWPTERLPYPL